MENLTPVEQTPIPQKSSNFKWLIVALIILAVGAAAYLLAGSKFFKGELQLKEAEDPAKKLQEMATTLANGGNISQYLEVDSNFQSLLGKLDNIQKFSGNAEEIIGKIKFLLEESKGVVISDEFVQVLDFIGVKNNTEKEIFDAIAFLDNTLVKIPNLKTKYGKDNINKEINDQFLTKILGFNEDTLKTKACISSLKNLKLTQSAPDKNKQVLITLKEGTKSGSGCMVKNAVPQKIRMNNINGKYLPAGFDFGFSTIDLTIGNDIAVILNPEKENILSIIAKLTAYIEAFKASEEKNTCKFVADGIELARGIIEENFENDNLPPIITENWIVDINTPLKISKDYMNFPDIIGTELKDGPLHGTIVENKARIIYTPDSNYEGFDSFVYTLNLDKGEGYYLGDNDAVDKVVSKLNAKYNKGMWGTKSIALGCIEVGGLPKPGN